MYNNVFRDHFEEYSMSILRLAEKYNAFQQRVGSAQSGGDLDSAFKEIPLLFAENFKKVINGVMLVSERSGLRKQLEEVKKAGGGWKIELKSTMPCVDIHKCVIRYHLISQNLGTFDIMAVLKSQPSGLLEEIDEIYYQPKTTNTNEQQ